MSSLKNKVSMSTSMLFSDLYMSLIQDIGLKSTKYIVVGILGIRIMKLWLEDLNMSLPPNFFLGTIGHHV